MSELMLDLSGIVKSYNRGKPGRVDVLRGADLQLQSGEVVALVAPSGAASQHCCILLACWTRRMRAQCGLSARN